MKMKKNKIKIKLLKENSQVPTKGSTLAAGYDLKACLDKDVFIMPRLVKKIPTGIAIRCPKGYFGAVFARSGLSTKQGLRPANCVGVIDEDYIGEIFVPLYNDSRQEQRIKDGDRIAQIVFLPILQNDVFDICEELEYTERGTGGFGSTGKN